MTTIVPNFIRVEGIRIFKTFTFYSDNKQEHYDQVLKF